MLVADAILQLDRLLESPDADRADGGFDLARGALLIAATDYPEVDIDGICANLTRMAEAARNMMPADATPLQQLNAVTDLLFGVIGIAGDREEYYDPRNSYLNAVLERRLGIPITLSLLCIEVARRAGVPVVGIGMPGHFLVQHREESDLFVDAFSGGLLLNREECAALLRQTAGDNAKLEAHHLEPVTPREILARILRNLKAIYWEKHAYDRCIATISALMVVLPDRPEEQRDRGVVHLKAGHHRESVADFASYLDVAPPDAADIEIVRNALAQLRATFPNL